MQSMAATAPSPAKPRKPPHDRPLVGCPSVSGLPWPFRVATFAVLCLALGILVVNLVLVVFGLLMAGVLHLLPYSPHRPPPVPGCPRMTVCRVQRLWRWNQRGYRHGTTKGSWVRRRVAGALFLGWWAMAPAMLALQFWMTARRSTRYYCDPADTTVLAITGHRNHWSIGDHASAKPGSQQGRRLRQLLLPTLTAYADAHGIAITANAAVPALVTRYAEDLPGLHDVGRALPRGRKMRREPARQIQLPHDDHRLAGQPARESDDVPPPRPTTDPTGRND